MKLAIVTFVALASTVLVGCDGDHDHPHDEPKTQTPAAAAGKPDDHGHDHGEFTPAELGSVTTGGYTFTVKQTSALSAGKEVDITLVQTAGTGDPKAIRLWVGIESAQGSTKVRTHKHGEKIEAHVEVPDPIPTDAKLWVEVETDQGKSAAWVAVKT